MRNVKCGAGDGTYDFQTVEVENHLNPDYVYSTVSEWKQYDISD